MKVFLIRKYIIMKKSNGGKIGVLFVCVSLLILSGCVNYIKPDPGAVAKVDARVPFVDGNISSSVLKTNDLQLEYAFHGNDDSFEITGELVFSRSITATYPVLGRFILRVNFLDAEGTVIASENISPNISSFSELPDVVQIKASGLIPQGSVAIAFNYFGTFTAASLRGGGGSLEVYYMPFG
jgi:hypothetical protein